MKPPSNILHVGPRTQGEVVLCGKFPLGDKASRFAVFLGVRPGRLPKSDRDSPGKDRSRRDAAPVRRAASALRSACSEPRSLEQRDGRHRENSCRLSRQVRGRGINDRRPSLATSGSSASQARAALSRGNLRPRFLVGCGVAFICPQLLGNGASRPKPLTKPGRSPPGWLSLPHPGPAASGGRNARPCSLVLATWRVEKAPSNACRCASRPLYPPPDCRLDSRLSCPGGRLTARPGMVEVPDLLRSLG